MTAPLVLVSGATFCWYWGWYWLRESAIGATDLQFTAKQEAALQTLDMADRA